MLSLNRTGLLPNNVKGGLDTGLLNWSSWNETGQGRLDEARRGFFLIFELVKICGNPDKSRWNSLDPSGCSLAKVAGAEALGR